MAELAVAVADQPVEQLGEPDRGAGRRRCRRGPRGGRRRGPAARGRSSRAAAQDQLAEPAEPLVAGLGQRRAARAGRTPTSGPAPAARGSGAGRQLGRRLAALGVSDDRRPRRAASAPPPRGNRRRCGGRAASWRCGRGGRAGQGQGEPAGEVLVEGRFAGHGRRANRRFHGHGAAGHRARPVIIKPLRRARSMLQVEVEAPTIADDWRCTPARGSIEAAPPRRGRSSVGNCSRFMTWSMAPSNSILVQFLPAAWPGLSRPVLSPCSTSGRPNTDESRELDLACFGLIEPEWLKGEPLRVPGLRPPIAR